MLILCTGKSCLSRMAEGFLRLSDSVLEVFSASSVHPLAVKESSVALLCSHIRSSQDENR